MNGDPNPYKRVHDYESAGFNGFFRRTIAGNSAGTLRETANSVGQQQIRFDNQQVSGALGDSLVLGRINLNGREGNITISDDRQVRAIFGAEPGG